MPSPRLRTEAATYGVVLSDEQVAQFDAYARLLGQWSERVNLVSDASEDVVERRHFLESIALGAALRERELLRPDSGVIDVGSGAGFPGVVLKLVWSSLRLTLLEATGKKTAFLDALVGALGLSDVTVRTGRAEELAHEAGLRGAFDLAVARAVAPLPALLELTLPFVRTGGRVAAVKGSRAAAELAASRLALDALGARALAMPLRVPGPPQRIIVAVKQRETPSEYPRRTGVPQKQPL
ncbi:MAG: 16S rRNA (guanine(527)-N(7))-methyltransferase RsmG [Dehalococcoidia bacterium]|nr:16S rRNA (guanine(527)-N(7))-methyltransferase RsmG [Dehalococcoidia bacterium]